MALSLDWFGRGLAVADSEAFRDVFYSAPDGLQLHARVYGTSSAEAS